MYKNMECVCFKVQLKNGCPCEEECGKMLWLPPEFWVIYPVWRGDTCQFSKVWVFGWILLGYFQSGVDIFGVGLIFPARPDGYEGFFTSLLHKYQQGDVGIH